jgi:hypothetical protein
MHALFTAIFPRYMVDARWWDSPRSSPQRQMTRSMVESCEYRELVDRALRLVNEVRHDTGEPTLTSFPAGSLEDAASRCPIAKALTAIVVLEERRIVFCYPWHAAAAAKGWRVPFADSLLMSVILPDALYEFADAFRRGLLRDFLE